MPYVVCAPNGCAAIGVSGSTLHAMAKCGVPRTLSDMDKCWQAKATWRALRRKGGRLIVDEISMIEPQFLDCLSAHVQEAVEDWSAPFGGIPLAFLGDFLQLPPVPGSHASLENEPPRRGEPDFVQGKIPMGVRELTASCRGSHVFKTGNLTPIHFTTVRRAPDCTLFVVPEL